MAGGHASVKMTNALGTVVTASLGSGSLSLTAGTSASAVLDEVNEAGDPDVAWADSASGLIVIERPGIYLLGCRASFSAPLGTMTQANCIIGAPWDASNVVDQQTVAPFAGASTDGALVIFEAPSRLTAGTVDLTVALFGSADGVSPSQLLWVVYLGA